MMPKADCLSRIPQTEDQVKDCDQVNQINTEEKIICSIGLRKSVEQLVEHQKNAADLIMMRNWIENRKHPQKNTWQEPLWHSGNYGLISETYGLKMI